MNNFSNQQLDYGKFFVIEGIDCCGKDTQIEAVEKVLSDMGYKVFVTNEPTYDGIGCLIRESLNNGLKDMNPKALSLLYIADRINHCDIMRKYLEDGFIVISSRYLWSNLAYNTDGSLIEMERTLSKNMVEKILIPESLIYLDITPEESICRMGKRKSLDAFENLPKQQKVYENYHTAIQMLTLNNVIVLDGTSDKNDITNSIVNHIISRL